MSRTLTVRVDTRITADEQDALTRLAQREDRSVAAIVRRAIRALLADAAASEGLAAIEARDGD